MHTATTESVSLCSTKKRERSDREHAQEKLTAFEWRVTSTTFYKATRLLTRKGLSDRWQVSTETLKRRERCGLLKCLKLGKGIRYRLSDVEALEEAAEVR